MTKIYVMESCPDCSEAKKLFAGNPDYELIDIGRQARNLKEFLALRDNHPAFAKVRERGTIGIPCFVKEDGSVAISLKHFLSRQDAEPEQVTGAEVAQMEEQYAEPAEKPGTESEAGTAAETAVGTAAETAVGTAAETAVETAGMAVETAFEFSEGASCSLDGSGC